MSLPQPFLDRLAKQFGPSISNTIIKAFEAERLPTFRTNTLRATDDNVMSGLREARAMFARSKEIPHAFNVRNLDNETLLALPMTKEGKIYVQGLTSMLPPLILAPKPNETVLDLCAAPGSKTSQLAALMNNQGKIVACEENEIRYQKLLNTIRIQGATCVDTRYIDATLLHHEMPEMFDKVLADVPCSAEGRIRLRDKRSYGFWSEKNIVAHAKLQRRLLRSAVACLKPGGILVYSTCTLAPEENEGMIDWLLAEYPILKTQSVELPFSPIKKHLNGSVTLLPSKDAEGFFVAKLKKA